MEKNNTIQILALRRGRTSARNNTGSPIDFHYTPPFKFTGKIERVTVELK